MKQTITRIERARSHGVKSSNIDAKALVDELRGTVRGEVRFDEGSRALYATDSSNYRQVPIGVVLPRDVEDVIATVAACRRAGTPLLARGGGTSLAGQCCNVAVVLDLSKYMNSIIEIDPDNKLARVQPGIILDHLRTTAERSHLTFGPDPAPRLGLQPGTVAARKRISCCTGTGRHGGDLRHSVGGDDTAGL